MGKYIKNTLLSAITFMALTTTGLMANDTPKEPETGNVIFQELKEQVKLFKAKVPIELDEVTTLKDMNFKETKNTLVITNIYEIAENKLGTLNFSKEAFKDVAVKNETMNTMGNMLLSMYCEKGEMYNYFEEGLILNIEYYWKNTNEQIYTKVIDIKGCKELDKLLINNPNNNQQ